MSTTTAPAAEAKWAVVDVETTGTTPGTHRIISVAALALDSDGTITDALVSLVNPGCVPGPTHIHGITQDMLIGKPRFSDVAANLAAILTGRTLVAHNAAFDYGFLAAEARRASTPLPVQSALCTLELARTLELGLDNLKLATLAKHWNVTQARPHDALDDALVLARILPHALACAHELAVPLPLRAPDTLAPPVFAAAA